MKDAAHRTEDPYMDSHGHVQSVAPCRPRSVAAALAALLVATAVAADAQPAPSTPLGCDQADSMITLEASAHLDPACTWTRGVRITASNVTLDCQGAHIATTDLHHGIEIVAPIDRALEHVVVRNCHVEGFLNNIHVQREGFRTLAPGVEYEHSFSDIVIEDSTILDSRGSGIFVNGYVTGVTLRNLRIEGAGSVGVYLEAGSRDNVIENCEFIDNGFGENGLSGQFFRFAGVDFWFWGTGREGLAIDGSRNNRVANNLFSGNAAGSIFLYKNCGEYVNQKPQRWFDRRHGANGNLIEGNTFRGGRNGVWIGSRMGENLLPMDCSDPQYQPGIVRDQATDNIVRENTFEDVTFGVRIEDDRSTVSGNTFTSSDPADQAVVIGTRYRTTVLDEPVDGTVVTGNNAVLGTSANPYRWVHARADTTFVGNSSLGSVVGLCEGEPPAIGPFVMTVAFIAADPANPPTGEPPTLPLPEVLPPCPLACTSAGPAPSTRIALGRLDTPAGDDTLIIKSRFDLPTPLSPALDPLIRGLGIAIDDAGGTRLFEVLLPGGAWDAATRRGWTVAPDATSWAWSDRSAAPIGGIHTVRVQDLSRLSPGRAAITVKGKNGSYASGNPQLPLSGLFILDPPAAESGQCGRATFDQAPRGCVASRGGIRCG